ncbi:MAG TPA: TetR/AcrR family transcriptional regulator [Roseiarcus sp.]|jgi:TetR/AcrR family transcriptional repressor of nem operon
MRSPLESRNRLLDAAIGAIRAKGYDATTVDDVCAAAALTKGAFFHHFRSKEDLAISAAERWGVTTGALFQAAPYHLPEDPLDRLLAYVDFRKALLQGAPQDFTCLLGSMVQETYLSRPAIRDACRTGIFGHVATLTDDIAAAKALYAPGADWTAESLALHTQAVIQGAFILAKADDGPRIAADCLDHLRRYIALLFGREEGVKP